MYDVIIIGGSYAGLSAAMALGRSLRNVLIIDHGKPCNRFTPKAHNFITHDGKKPALIVQEARQQVQAYKTVSFENDKVIAISGENNQFKAITEQGSTFTAKKLLFATGLRDILPDIPGLVECWGISVVHCPYCHGYEIRGKNTGILVNGELALYYGELISNWTHNLTVFTNGPADFNRKDLEVLKIKVLQKEVLKIEHHEGNIKSLLFKDGSEQALEALYHKPKTEQHCTIPQKLGCQMSEQGLIQVNSFQETSIPGVYAAGDCTSMFRALSMATASGTVAGAIINKTLISDDL